MVNKDTQGAKAVQDVLEVPFRLETLLFYTAGLIIRPIKLFLERANQSMIRETSEEVCFIIKVMP